MFKQMGLWDEPPRADLWDQFPAGTKEQLVMQLARLAVEAARPAKQGTAKKERRKGDGTERRTGRDER